MRRVLTLRDATLADLDTLNAIALAAKAHWGYSPQVLESWRDELTLTPDVLESHITLVALIDHDTPAGFGQLDPAARPWDMNALWVDPAYLRRGIGSRLLDALAHRAREVGQPSLTIDADPNAVPFYLARGAAVVGAIAAPLPGEPGRERPQMLLPLDA